MTILYATVFILLLHAEGRMDGRLGYFFMAARLLPGAHNEGTKHLGA